MKRSATVSEGLLSVCGAGEIFVGTGESIGLVQGFNPIQPNVGTTEGLLIGDFVGDEVTVTVDCVGCGCESIPGGRIGEVFKEL